MERTEVLIAGAGPTGLVLALWLARLGVKVRIIDKAAEPGTTSRALAVHARTLELYRQLGLTEAVVAGGHKVPAANLWARGKRRARLDFSVIGSNLTPYPFLHIFPQDEHERLLIGRLAEFGVTVERPVELVGFEEFAEGVRAHLAGPGVAPSVVDASYLAGCDGARSTVRQVLKTGFPGGTYRHVFYVADIEARGAVANGELHLDLEAAADFLAVFPLKGAGRARLIGTVGGERAQRAETLSFEDVSHTAIADMKLEVDRVNWFSTYNVHHRVAEHFRVGRAFLLGDAAHIHSPVGGQGMNTGIGDAINLAWKLAAVIAAKADEALLQSYEPERIAFARRLVASTDRAFDLVTAHGPLAEVTRTRLVPPVLTALVSFELVREFAFRTVSQVTLNYRAGPLSRGVAGKVRGGDRLPWVAEGGRPSERDNFTALEAIRWQAHVYGSVPTPLEDACARLSLPLHAFGWRPEHENAGLARDALYVVRPDGYIGLADKAASPAALEHYFADLRLAP